MEEDGIKRSVRMHRPPEARHDRSRRSSITTSMEEGYKVEPRKPAISHREERRSNLLRANSWEGYVLEKDGVGFKKSVRLGLSNEESAVCRRRGVVRCRSTMPL